MSQDSGVSAEDGAHDCPWVKDGLPADVRLVFGDSGADPLPAHSQVLSLASPVLREALALAKPRADGVKLLPMPGDEPAQWKLVRAGRGVCCVWRTAGHTVTAFCRLTNTLSTTTQQQHVQVLSVLYDGLFKTGGRHDEQLINWANAEALAVLADKYDVACLRDAVDRFASDAKYWDFCCGPEMFDSDGLLWLGIASRCNLPKTFGMLLASIDHKVAARGGGGGAGGTGGLKCRRAGAPPDPVTRGLDGLTARDTRALLLVLLGYGQPQEQGQQLQRRRH
jgi:hypothetical protein